MLKDYSNVPNIKNQFGVDVPVFMINMYGNTRESTIQKMKSKGYKDIYAPEYHQEFINYVFTFHKEEFGKEHEANLCKSDADVWQMYMKNKFNHIKNIVHRKKGTDIYELPNDYIYMGAFTSVWYDENDVIDMESSEIKLYHVHPDCNDGMETMEFSLDEFSKIQDLLNKIPKNKPIKL